VANVRPLYIPPPSQEPAESGALILRDGTTALIRVARPDDRSALQAFVDRLSPEAKRHRFFSETTPPAEVIESLCDSSDPRSKLTLIVTRVWQGAPRIIAAGSYFAKDNTTAEVAMAVDEAFHGKGLGTLLLERLALLGGLVPGGWPALMARNRTLALDARRLLCAAAGTEPACPDEMLGSLASVILPDSPTIETGWRQRDPLQARLFDGWGIEVPIMRWPAAPRRLIRVSAQLYNSPEQYARLAEALRKELAAETLSPAEGERAG